MNSGEKRAWEALRALRAEGVHAVRQHQIGRYTVDFAIRRSRIAIEIDGAVHDFPGRPEYDAQRQAYIENKGWRVVRVRSEATHDAANVVDAVRAALSDMNEAAAAHPLPLRGGGRGRGETQAPANSCEEQAQMAGNSASPRPPTPSPRGEGEFPPRLRRRTRASRVLPPRRTT